MTKITLIQNTIDILQKLISFNSESSLNNLLLINYIETIIKENDPQKEAIINLSYDASKEKANLLVSLPAYDGSIEGGILLSGHTDVVPVEGQDWQTDPYKMEQKDGRLYGRGTCDMKGFIAACLAMFAEFKKIKRKRPIHMAFSYDEEVGCLGAKVMAEQMQKFGIIPNIAIIGEPTEMQVVIGHKGCNEYTTEFKGLPGHSSLPDIGVNAIEYAVDYTAQLLSLRPSLKKNAPHDNPFTPPYTTLQVGKIKGGTAHNVIAEHCFVDWQTRTIQDEDNHTIHQHIDNYAEQQLLPKMQQVYPQAHIHKKIISEVNGLPPMEESEAKEFVCRLTGQQQTTVVSYGTEAGIFKDLGCSTIVCGPGSIEQAHKADEFVSIEQLEKCLEMLVQLETEITLP
jgi:acetylornithine deacetylase